MIKISENEEHDEKVFGFCAFLYLISIPFILGGALNFGHTGFFFALPFIFVNILCYSKLKSLALGQFQRRKLLRYIHLTLWVITLIFYLLRTFEIQNPFFFPANGRTFVLTEDYCLVEHDYTDNIYPFSLVRSRNKPSSCLYRKDTSPKGILLKKGDKFKVIETRVETTGIATEYYSILYKTDAGIAEFSSYASWGKGDPIKWDDNGEMVKQEDYYNTIVKTLGTLMFYPFIFFK